MRLRRFHIATLAVMFLLLGVAAVIRNVSDRRETISAIERQDGDDGVSPPGLIGRQGDPPTAPRPSRTGRSGARTPAGGEPTGNAAGIEDFDARIPQLVGVQDGAMPEGWADAPPAQRPHPIRPPAPRGGPQLGPRAGPAGPAPTGHRTRFPPPPPPTGTARLVVVVEDADGTPLPGADVYLAPPAALGSDAVSFGDLRRLGRTTDQGRLVAATLPAGAAVLAGNLANHLNGPRGLDARSSVPILLAAGRETSARLRLPVARDRFGTIHGRIVDPRGRAVAHATVLVGYQRVRSDPEGRFEIARAPVGVQTLVVRRTGYASARREVDVPEGERRDVEIELDWQERGAIRLEGRVVRADGHGLAGATVYLIDESGRGTLRSVQTDAEGRYLFEDLPDRLREAPVRVQAGDPRRGFPTRNERLERGIREPVLDFLLPPQRGLLRLRLRDAEDGTPVTRCRVGLWREEDPGEQVRGFTGSDAEGLFEHWYDVGRYRVEVEAPDHRAAEVAVHLPNPGDTIEVDVKMTPRAVPAARVALEVVVRSVTTDEPVTRCVIEVLDPESRAELSRFEGANPDGRYALPAPSGTRLLRVGAEGYETIEKRVALPADPPEAREIIHLRPR